jgi:competence protein ComEC
MLPPVAWIALAYGAGLWTGLVLLAPDRVIWMVAAAGAVLVAMRPRAGVLIGAAAIGMLSGVWRVEAARFECATVWRAGPVSAVLRIHDAPGAQATTSGTVLHGTGGCRGVVRLRLERPVPAGATMLMVGIARGLGVVRVHHVRLLPRPRPWRFRIRALVQRRIRVLYGARAGLVDALVLGRRDDVPPGLRQTFADAGLAHLLAISGLHVGILSSWLLLVLKRIGLGEHRWLPTVALTWAYVALLGAPAPAMRAAGFLSLYAVARVRQRHPPLSAIVALSLLVILAIDPRAATSVGLWLSMAAVLGTSWGTRVTSRLRWSHPVARLAASSCGAVLFTAPITAFAFGAVAPVGILANLVAIPLASIAVPAVFLSLVGGGLVAGGAGVALAAVERVAATAAALPGACMTGLPGVRFALPWMLVLGAALYLTGRDGSVLSRPRQGRRRLHRLLVLAALGVWGGAVLPVWRGWRGATTLEIHVLNVGQGDAILLRTPSDRWILVDGGPRTARFDAGARVVLPFLRRHGARALAAVFVSHGDADHLGGVPRVLDGTDVGLVVEPGQPLGTALYLEYLATVDARGIEWRVARAGDTITIDSLVLAVLHPRGDWVRDEFEPNENSVVIHLRYGCFDALLAGDAGARVERELHPTVPQVEVLKVGHHGSAGSTTVEWLAELEPEVAVISVGPNRYGHPAPGVLERLAARDVAIRRTDRGGTVTIRTDGRYYSVDQGRPTTLLRSLLCRIRQSSRSSGSSSNRSGCILRPPVISRTCSMTLPSPQR